MLNSVRSAEQTNDLFVAHRCARPHVISPLSKIYALARVCICVYGCVWINGLGIDCNQLSASSSVGVRVDTCVWVIYFSGCE